MLNLSAITDHKVVWEVDSGDITVSGQIDDHCLVFLESTGGNITIQGKIDNNCRVTLNAPNGSVFVGTTGSADDQKIDGNSSVKVTAGKDVRFGSYLHRASADVISHGTASVAGELSFGSRIRFVADGNITLGDAVDGSARVELVSNQGSVTIDKKVSGQSKAWITAATDVKIGQIGSDDDKKIDGDSFVNATAGGLIDLGGVINGSNTMVDLAACGSVSIGQAISGGATVRLASAAATINVTGGLSDSNTRVTFSPVAAPFKPALNNGAPSPVAADWTHGDPLCLAPFTNGPWWENWSQTFGYVVPERAIPRSLDELVLAVTGSGNVDRPDTTPVKAVGGGWSFTDASLPLQQSDVDRISIVNKGRRGQQSMHSLLDNLPSAAGAPMDLLPGAVTHNLAASTAYNQATLAQITMGGAQLPSPAAKARLIDTRGLASSLQCNLSNIRTTATSATPAGRPMPSSDEILFWVEAGITIADLQQLLDHQSPRLALQATGGSPGATLAGTLSTATHGGEWSFKLLVDQVRAIHLVGPGGEQWWIEGSVPVADLGKLQANGFPKIGAANFIAGSWTMDGLTPQDVLDAVTVSMGTMGVIYSVVLAVVPQFGIHQIVTSMPWNAMLQKASITETQLRSGDTTANLSLVDAILDGSKNGTGIGKGTNIYADLAINPINQDCWIVNRESTPIPDDANLATPSIDDYLATLEFAMADTDDVGGNKLFGRVFDMLHWMTNLVNFATSDIVGDLINGGPETTAATSNLLGFLGAVPNMLVGALATACFQVRANVLQDPTNADNGINFFGDMLTGIFHAMQGTRRGKNSETGINADSTGVSYKVGAIGWPDTGVPGRGFEIALDPTNAFTFLQTALFDDVFPNVMRNGNNPFVGYISVRICPPSRRLVAMQQYSPQSVMIEVVAYRSPEANTVMDAILDRVHSFGASGPKPILHWGLENGVADPAMLAASPLGQPYKGSMSRLDVFRQVRTLLRKSHPPVFDNAFTARLGL